MTLLLRLLGVVLVWLGCFAGLSGVAHAAPEKRSVKIDGLQRTFYVNVPPSAPAPGKRGAIVVFHGAGPNRSDDKGRNFAKATRMAAAAGEYGAVTVFANGVDGGWYPPEWAPEGVDDLKFAKRIHRILIDDYGVRPGRVAAAGFSSGGHMAMQWACADPMVGGLVVVGASLSKLQSGRCRVHDPLPTLFILGTNDPINPYRGGEVNGVRSAERDASTVLSARRSAGYFARGNTCKAEPRRKPLRSPRGKVIGDRDKYRGCGKGKVELLSLPMGHKWPLAGTPMAQRGASATIAEFLKKRVWRKRLR